MSFHSPALKLISSARGYGCVVLSVVGCSFLYLCNRWHALVICALQPAAMTKQKNGHARVGALSAAQHAIRDEKQRVKN